MYRRLLGPYGIRFDTDAVLGCFFGCGGAVICSSQEFVSMKKTHIAFIGGASMVCAFVFATYVYNNQRAEQGQALAEQASASLLRDHSPSMGPSNARVVLVEFFDPGCEACRVFASHVKELLALHKDSLRLVLRYAPFHHGADTMVKILEASRRQGKYWETLEVMFESQKYWASHHHPQPEKIWEFLPAAGVNIERLRSDMNDPEFLEIIRQDMEDAKSLGIRKTPSFFVNGKPLQTFGLQQLKDLVSAEIAAKS